MSISVKLNKTLMLPKASKSSSFFLSKSPSVASWKAKKLIKNAEEAKKMNKDLQLVNEKKKAIQENKTLNKVYIEKRKDLLERNSKCQVCINEVVAEIQNIRKNNENLHQEAMKLAKRTQDLVASEGLYVKEQGEVMRDIESCEKEICVAQKMNKANFDRLVGVRDKVKGAEELVGELNRKIKVAENEKRKFLEVNWKVNKEIKRVKHEIQKLQRLTSKN